MTIRLTEDQMKETFVEMIARDDHRHDGKCVCFKEIEETEEEK